MSVQNIKTWEDIEKELPEFFKLSNSPNPMMIQSNELRNRLFKKVMAIYKIAILIEYGYGGAISDEEWEDTMFKKYGILYRPYKNGKKLFIKDIWDEKCFIAFHTREQAKEFMSYPENIELIRQYNML